MNGIINVYKEKGFTSHDVVAKLRGILHMKKIAKHYVLSAKFHIQYWQPAHDSRTFPGK